MAGALDGAIRSLNEDSGRRGSDRLVKVGRRRLDQFKYALIQLKPTEDVCEELVQFLVDYLGTDHVGIYLWNESEGTFSLQQEIPGVRHGWRVFEPFLMYMADNDSMVLRNRSLSGLPSEVVRQKEDFFEQTDSDLIIPLVLNESLLGIVFIGPPGSIEWNASRLNALSEVRSLVTMALSNSILYARLQGILENLEEKVKERTRRLEETQAHLVQSEKMAMLGVMIAGIAHEINTPAGVIFGGSMNLEQNLQGVLDHSPYLLNRLGEERLKELMHISLEQSRKKIHVSGAFKKKKELQNALEPWNGLADLNKLVGHLVETGVYSTPEDLHSEAMETILRAFQELHSQSSSDARSGRAAHGAPDDSVASSGRAAHGPPDDSLTSATHGPAGASSYEEGSHPPDVSSDVSADDSAGERLLEFLKLISSTGKNLSNIRGSIESIVRIVRALKSYSHPGQKTFGPAKVEEGLNNTLIILSSVWKGNVNVEKDIQQTPDIECDADELNQVWTNLLTNSWQAMKGQQDATLYVSTRYLEDARSIMEEVRSTDTSRGSSAVVGEVSGPGVCVTIRDNGPGIPSEHIEKIWDPFFTTKDQGEGSGLGLSIVRRIVEEHGGAVAVRTGLKADGGGTQFCVILPREQDEETLKKKEVRSRELAELKREERGQSMPFKFR